MRKMHLGIGPDKMRNNFLSLRLIPTYLSSTPIIHDEEKVGKDRWTMIS